MDIKKLAQYTLFAALGTFLLYRTYCGTSLDELIEISAKVKFKWIMLAILAHLVNHFLRSFRWRLLVEVQGYEVSQGYAFLAEMSGFFMNLVPPRMGDWIRCVVLKRLERVPVSKSLGGVVVERFIDIFLFLCLCIIAFLIEFLTHSKTLPNLAGSLQATFKFVPSNSFISVIIVALALLGIVSYKWYGQLVAMMWLQVKLFFKEVLVAIRRTRKCNPWILWSTSLFILFFHFMVEYLSFFAIEEIVIDWQGALCVFIAMNIGMSAPTPGGIGVYHVGVISTLMALGVENRYAIVYATITHSIQLFNALVIGGICFLIATFLPDKKKKKAPTWKNR